MAPSTPETGYYAGLTTAGTPLHRATIAFGNTIDDDYWESERELAKMERQMARPKELGPETVCPECKKKYKALACGWDRVYKGEIYVYTTRWYVYCLYCGHCYEVVK